MKIALIDTFYDASHRAWAEGMARHCTAEIDIYSLSPHHWKWRMMGGSVELAERVNKSTTHYDLIVITDMVNLPVFKAMLREDLAIKPVLMYFHENQITYPHHADRDPIDIRRDRHYGFINFMSAKVAQVVVFNSHFHKNDFLTALPDFLNDFPRFKFLHLIENILQKSHVIPVGVDKPLVKSSPGEKPIFLWNHRWEHDKGPEVFFESLFELKNRGCDFGVIVTGKSFKRTPEIFQIARQTLKKEIMHFGYVSNEDYHRMLSIANIVLITSKQDFFCISFIEALLAGCLPVIPDRLVFKEHLPAERASELMYDRDALIPDLLAMLIEEKRYLQTDLFRDYVQQYLWERVHQSYDVLFSQMTNQ